MFFTHIAIIDDGVNEKIFNLGNLLYNLEISTDLEVYQRKDYDSYNISHGTVCAAMIKKYYPYIIFSSIKILDTDTQGTIEQLIKAIEWCVNHKIRNLHLSLGSIHFKDFDSLQVVINNAFYKGHIIIAACENSNIISYPATLSNVIGVSLCQNDKIKLNEYFYHNSNIDGIDITAHPENEIIDCFGDKHKVFLSNSYTAPMISALVAKFLNENPKLSFYEIKQQLYLGSSNIDTNVDFNNYSYRIDWINNAVILSFDNFDFHQIQKYIKFNIVQQILIDINHKNECLFELNQIFSENRFIDTLICFISSNTNDFKYLYDILINYNKNLIFFSNTIIKEPCNNLNIKIFHSYLFQNQYFINSQPPLYYKEVNIIPLVLFFEMDRDKLLTILHSFKIFLETDGYLVLPISDSIIDKLIEFEYIDLQQDQKYINYFYKDICKNYSADIFLFGVHKYSDYEKILKLFHKEISPDIVFIFNDIDPQILNFIHDNNQSAVIVNIGENSCENFDSNKERRIYNIMLNLFNS